MIENIDKKMWYDFPNANLFFTFTILTWSFIIIFWVRSEKFHHSENNQSKLLPIFYKERLFPNTLRGIPIPTFWIFFLVFIGFFLRNSKKYVVVFSEITPQSKLYETRRPHKIISLLNLSWKNSPFNNVLH